MSDRWSKPTIALHWLAALLILGMAGAGFVMTSLPVDSPLRHDMARLHTLTGAAVMLLTLARLFFRWRTPAPAPLPLGPLHQKFVRAVHALLYLVVLLLGFSGLSTAVRSAWPDYVLGPVPKAPDLSHLTSRHHHGYLAVAMLVLVGLHLGGALLQQLKGGDALRRMIPFMK